VLKFGRLLPPARAPVNCSNNCTTKNIASSCICIKCTAPEIVVGAYADCSRSYITTIEAKPPCASNENTTFPGRCSLESSSMALAFMVMMSSSASCENLRSALIRAVRIEANFSVPISLATNHSIPKGMLSRLTSRITSTHLSSNPAAGEKKVHRVFKIRNSYPTKIFHLNSPPCALTTPFRPVATVTLLTGS